jgi:hypothetical protein
MTDNRAPDEQAVEHHARSGGSIDTPLWSRSFALSIMAGLATTMSLAPIYIFEEASRVGYNLPVL